MPAAAATPTRDRVLAASAELFRRQGYAGTGLKQVAATAGAPFGSIYHFFPGGKEQLADEVLRTGGAFFLALYEAIVADAPDVPTGIAAFFAGAAETLRATDYADACPIATVAGEIASTHDGLRRATADVFESWLAAMAQDLERAGVTARRARPLALSTDAPDGSRIYANRTCLVIRTRWDRIVEHEDFYEDTGRILALEQRLQALGVAPIDATPAPA